MLKQSFQQKLLQKLSPQQIQLMKLLQVPTVELEQRIKEELEVNPALEEGREETEDEFEEQEDFEEKESTESQEDFDISDYLDDDTPDYKLSASNRSADDEDKQVPIGSGRTFSEILTTQLGLRNLTEKQEELADYLIGNLDDSGYLRRELGAIVNDMAFSQNLIATEEELEAVLKIIQQFDPPGVGGRNLRECLLIQMKRKNNHSPAQELAVTLLQNFFEEFTKKHYSKISKKLDLEDSDLKGAIDEILKLNPKPGNSLMESSKTVPYVVPDFLVLVEEDELKLSLNQRNAPELKVSRQYRNMLETYAASKGDKKQKEAIMFVKQKIDSAKWFIDAIRQRQNTLLITMHAILEYQKEYFLSGDETKIKPMILKDIAEIVEMDISTISRVANSKYVQTPYGTFLLKTFFSESLSTDSGEEVSTREVKKILQEAIDGESKRKPLTDEKLAKLLKDKGYNIARRTVAKYREQLNIPVARLRKEL
jgi:RNA polymerase sigma-54 factor